ncbi:MAG: hypothetical protein ACPGQL_05975 [Thermoplasmatota archaeon]
MSQRRHRLFSVVLPLLLASTALAGCTDLLGGDGTPASTGTLSRALAIAWDPEAMDEAEGPTDAMAALVDTVFTYHHDGDALSTDDIEVRYQDETGRTQVHSLGRFTTLSEVQQGDTVELDGALATSGIELLRGDRVLAARAGAQTPWLEAGIPLPVASTDGGSASWDLDVTGAIDVAFDRFAMSSEEVDGEYVCDGDQCTYEETRRTIHQSWDDATGEADWAIDARLRLDAVPAGEEMLLTAAAEGTMGLDVLGTTTVTRTTTPEDGEPETKTFPQGFDLAIDGTFEAEADGRFDASRQLRSMTGDYDARADGHLFVWNETIAREDDHQPDWVPSPLLDAQGTWSESGIPAAPFEMAQFFAALWGMDLQEGDALSIGHDDGDLSFTYEVRVLSRGPVEIAGTTRDAFRLATTIEVGFEALGGLSESYRLASDSYWIDAESHLPLRLVGQAQASVDEDDLETLFDGIGTFAAFFIDDLELPEEVTIGARSDVRLELVDLDGDLQTAPLLTGSGALTAPLLVPFYVVALLAEL